jgi:hypothetical protein
VRSLLQQAVKTPAPLDSAALDLGKENAAIGADVCDYLAQR